MIQKNIFQFWTTQQIPFYMRSYMNTWKKAKGGYRHHLYDERQMDDFVKEHYPNFFEDYRTLHIVTKTDILRFMLVYAYGGFYADLDTSLNCNLDDLCASFPKANVLLGLEINLTEEEKKTMTQFAHSYSVCNWTFAATQGHPLFGDIINDMIDSVRRHPELKNNLYKIETTGPPSCTRTYLARKHAYTDVELLPISYFGAGQKHSQSPTRRKGYIIHYFLGSWKKKRSLISKLKFWIRPYRVRFMTMCLGR